MPTVAEILQAEGNMEEKAYTHTPLPGTQSPVEPQEQERRTLDLSWLKVETGQGEISDYMDEPLNFTKKEGMARVLRGATGYLGTVRFAILDIVVGLMMTLRGQ